MSVKPTLTTQLSQRLVLTPQLRQRIEMLQMTKLELSDLVTQQMVENPVLEEVPPEEISVTPPDYDLDTTPDVPAAALNGAPEIGADSVAPSVSSLDAGARVEMDLAGGDFESGVGAEPTSAAGDLAATTAEGMQPTETVDLGEGETRERDSFEEIDFGSTFEEYLDPGYRTRESEVKESPSFEQFLKSEQNLSDYLLWQLHLTITDADVRDAAEAIIGNLNDDGYLEGTLEEMAQIGPWGPETVAKAL